MNLWANAEFWKTMTAIITGLSALIMTLIKLKIIQKKQTRAHDPRAHSFFTKCDYWLRLVIPSIRLTSGLKAKLAKDYLTLYVSVFRDGLLKYFERRDKICDAAPEMIKEHQDLFLNLKKEVDDRCREKKLPSLFISKINAKNKNWDVMMFNDIEDMCQSDFYSTCDDKNAAILDSYVYYLRRLIMDAERTMKELNGELEAVLKEGK